MTPGRAVLRHIAYLESVANRICPHCRTLTLGLNQAPSCECGYVREHDPFVAVEAQMLARSRNASSDLSELFGDR